jgi:hypothetical protein
MLTDVVNEGDAISGVFNLEFIRRRPRHGEHYHEA